MEHLYLQSAGGGQLHCRIWEPEGTPAALLQIVHGIAEHVERYDDFARFLNAHGILVAADDHMGHGKTLREGETQGYFEGGWLSAVADSRQLQQWLMEQYPGVPCFLLGHSMGSFMARTMLFTYPDSGIRGAIISGTGWQPAIALKVGLALCRREEKRYGDRATSAALNRLVFGGYNKKFKPNRTAYDWLCTDEAVVDRYIDDPLCGFDATIGLARDMLTGIRMIEQPENLGKMNKDLPVWFFAGDHDPVGNMGQGVRRVAEAFRQAGMKHVTVTLYEGRHEMLNEKNKQQVYADVLHWLESQRG